MLPRYNLSQSFHSASNIAKKQLQKNNEKYLIDTKTLKKHMDFRLRKKQISKSLKRIVLQQLVPSDSLGLHNMFFVIRSLVLHITIQKNGLCVVNRGNELHSERMIGKNYLSAGTDS